MRRPEAAVRAVAALMAVGKKQKGARGLEEVARQAGRKVISKHTVGIRATLPHVLCHVDYISQNPLLTGFG